MLPRIKELRKLKTGSVNEKLHDRLTINCVECKQALVLPGGDHYCGMWKEKTRDALCRHCPCYDREALEYKLFRRE